MIALAAVGAWLGIVAFAVALVRMAQRPTPAPTFSALDSPEDVKQAPVLAGASTNPATARAG